MKKLISLFTLSLSFLFITMSSNAQVTDGSTITVSGSTGANGNYSSLTQAGGAFATINGAGSQAGNNIVITIFANVTTEDGANSLNANDWTTLTISPGGGAARTISGSIIGHLIDLSGADNVTIDGLNTGGNSLTIINNGTGASSTIRLTNDATNNTITNCTLQGSASTASNGVVIFSTGTITGNDGNNINNCNITAAGANLPINGIFSLGTSAAIDNSGNTINANNISDYFSATAVSIGINLSATGSGNSAWTITNNRLFQTATRIYTTAQTHNGIFIGTGSGYAITGNIIGYATSSGTGTTNIVGNTVALTGTFPSSYTTTGTANATRYIAINCTFTAGGTVSSIQNNTIAGFALYTSSGATTTNGILCGINVTSGNADIGTTTGNTIGTSTSSIYTACTTSGGTIVGIFASSINAVNIQNNIIQNLDAMGTSATVSGGITGINSTGTLGNFTITGNTIGNATNPNMRMGNLTTGANLSNVGTTFGIASGTSTFTGILNSATGTVTIGSVALPNTIQNASQNSSATGSSFRGINISGGSYTITGNTIRNITSANTNVTTATGLLAGVGILGQGGTAGSVITLNTINNLALSNTTTTGTNVAGVSLSNTSVDVTRNKIYDLRNASTSTTVTTPGTASGVFIRSGTALGNTRIINNMISLGNGQTTNTAFIGIQGNHGSTPNPIDNIYYNSVNIEGAATSGAQPSFGFYRGDFSVTARTVTVDIRNNIFNNTRSGGTGKHYAIANNYGAVTSSVGWAANASNYNTLNAAASTVGYWTTDQTFAGWKTASASDANSFSGITATFVNTATGDLHLNMGVTPTVLESGGTPITGITVDYDNDTRPGPTGSVNGGAFAPDLGADEFDGVPLDLSGPSISYSLLSNTNSASNRSFTGVTITDPSGVNVTPGTAPRVYYKRKADANTFNDNTSGTAGWKFDEANGVTSPFDFTIDYSLLSGGGGVIIGDSIQYFVVAQDLVAPPNVGINSGTFTVQPSSVALTVSAFPIGGTINSYIIVGAPLAGDYTVGVTAFNLATGRNITFSPVLKKVLKEVLEPVIPVAESGDKNNLTEKPTADQLEWKKVTKEFDETTYVPMENGRPYTGPLFVKRTENPNLPDNLLAGAYLTISAAVSDLNLRGLTGPVRFLLIDNTYTGETLPITVNITSTFVTSSTNTVTIKPNTGIISSIAQSGAATSVFKIFNTNYVTIDGSNTTGGTTRDLTIENTSTATPSVVWFGSNGTIPITDGSLRNCIIRNGANTSSAVVISDGTTLGNAGFFSNITIQNNDIQKAYIGVFATGGTTPQNGSNLIYTQNVINTSGTNAIRLCGLYMQGVNGATVTQNTIGNFNFADGENDMGIWLATGTINASISNNTISTLGYSGTSAFAPIGINVTSTVASTSNVISQNTISTLTSSGASSSSLVAAISITGATGSVTIERNNVMNIGNTNSGTWPAVGINLNGGSNNIVRNNFVSRVYNDQTAGTGAFSPTFGVSGIRLNAGTGHQVYYNSVNLYGAMSGAISSDMLICLAFGSTTVTGCDVRNNLLSNQMTGGNPSGGNTRFVAVNLPTGATSAMNLTWNNNAYFEGTDANCRMAVVGTTVGTGDFAAANFNPGAITPATNFRSYTNSLSVTGSNDNASLATTTAPTFLSNSDLHLNITILSPVSNKATPIAGITTDIDADTRNATVPDIGADEFTKNLSLSNLYVNDNSTTGDVYTSAVGNDANSGVSSDPFGTLSYALSQATPGDVIWVDAGSYPQTSVLTIPLNVTIKGANFGINPTAPYSGTQTDKTGGVRTSGARVAESIIDFTGFSTMGTMITISSSTQVIIDGLMFKDDFPITATGSRAVMTVFTHGNHMINNNIISRAAATEPVTGSSVSTRALEITSIASGETITISANKFLGNSAGVFTNKNFRTGIYYNGGLGTVNVTNNNFEFIRTAMNVDDITSGLNITGNTFASNGTAISMGGSVPPAGSYAFGSNDFSGLGTIINCSNVAPGFYLDLTTSSYTTIPFSSLTLEQLFGIEAIMVHGTNTGKNGLVRVLQNHVFVLPTTAPASLPKGGMQRGVNIALVSDTVDADSGNYVEQVEINKNLAVIGQGAAGTNVVSPASLPLFFTTSANNYPVIYARDAANIIVRNLTVDGAGQGNSNNRIVGVGYYQAGGYIEDLEIKAVRHNPLNGAQGGTGIFGYANTGTARTLSVKQNNVYDFQKNGITMAGLVLTASVDSNTVTGAGPTTLIAQNGVQVGGSKGSVTNNDISGIYFTPATFFAVGILAFDNADTLRITGNTLDSCQGNIYVYNNNSVISSNVINGGSFSDGIDVVAFPGQTTNTIAINNAISNCAWGVYIYSDSAGSADAEVHENSITGSSTYAIQNDGSVATVDAECNWYGTASPGGVTSQINGAVDYEPWLTNGTDNSPDKGFQPVPNSCNGFLLLTGKLNLTICLEACRPMDDTVTVSMRSTISPYAVIGTASGVLDTSGNVSLNFSNVSNGPSYYIVVNHRNSIETWSATGQTFTAGVMTYDFTTDTSKAFGGNMTFVGSEACIYTGDVDQDGAVDGTDAALIENDAYNYTTGYINTDLNCDGIVDGTDALYVDNNSYKLVVVEKPTIDDNDAKTVNIEKASVDGKSKVQNSVAKKKMMPLK